MHSLTSYDPVPWWVVLLSYVFTVYGAYLLQPHYPDFFTEQGFIKNWGAMLLSISILFFIGRGLHNHYGWFPVLALVLLMDRDLTVSDDLLHTYGLNALYWKRVAIPLIAGYGVYFFYVKAALLRADYQRNRSLGILFVGLSLLSLALVYFSPEIPEADWLAEVSKLLFAAITIYALSVMRKAA